MSYNPKYTINDIVRSNLQEIERLKDIVLGHKILPEAEASVHLRATVDKVHSSTSIEGIIRPVLHESIAYSPDNGKCNAIR